jgi:hypothetical protein
MKNYENMLDLYVVSNWTYQSPTMKMHIENANTDATTKNLVSLCNVEFILRFPCIIPLLDCMHTLIKLVEG